MIGRRYIERYALGALLVMAASGCSYVEQFFVINSSGAPVVVTASGATVTNVNTGERVCAWALPSSESRRLRVVAAEKVGRAPIALDEMTDARTTVDETSCAIRVSVAPQEAVLLWSTSNGVRVGFPTKIIVGVSTPAENPTVPPIENPTDRRGDEPQFVAAS